MPPHRLELPDKEDDPVGKMALLLFVLATLGMNINQAKGGKNTTQNHEVILLGNTTELIEFLNGQRGVTQTPTRENEDMKSPEFRALFLSNLANAAEEKFDRLGNIRDIEKAIEYRGEVLALTPDGHEEKHSRLGAQGSAFYRRFMRIADLADLNKATELLSQAVLLGPNGHPHKVTSLNNLGNTYQTRFWQFGELADLNKAIEFQTQAVQLTPDWHPDKPTGFNNLGSSYESRFARFGEVADINQAIEYLTQAVLLTPDGEDGKPVRLSNLGLSYNARFGQLGGIEDLNKAIEYQTQAVLLTPDGHADKPDMLKKLGGSYEARFEQLGKLADLNKAIEYQTQAVQLTPDWHPDKPAGFNNLGSSYESRFARLGEVSDINKAIEYLTQAVLLTPDGEDGKPVRLSNLGQSYNARFGQLGGIEDLNKAIEYQTQAVQLIPDGHADSPDMLKKLGGLYEARFERLGKLADLNKAIEDKTQAVRLTPDGHPLKPDLIRSLGDSYESRFKRLGKLVDLNKAIEYQTQSLMATSDGHPDKPGRLNNLGISYQSRFGRLGELEDLGKAIEYKAKAVLLTPDQHPEKPHRLNNLGNSYRSRFERMGELEDLHMAIEYHTQAVLLTPDEHPDKPMLLSSLAGSHDTLFGQLGRLEDANKAIEYFSQALPFTPDGHLKSMLLNNFGMAYNAQFDRFGKLEDVNKAIEYTAQAVLLVPDGHVDKPSFVGNLANAYHSRFRLLGDLSDHKLAQSFFQTGAQLALTHPLIQSRCARLWAKCSSMLGISPKPAFERCMELIPHCIWLGTTINQRYMLLHEIGNLATEAAAWAISVEAFELALEWLEEGRAIIWGQILQLRTPFDSLSLVDSVLARVLKDIASKLEAAGSRHSAELSDNTPSDLAMNAQHHHHLASEWERLLEQARALPGFERFLRPRKASELVPSATDGPVVVINAHSTRCDALIIFPGCDDIVHLPLPSSSGLALAEARAQLQSLVGHRGDRVGGFKRAKPAPKPENTFKDILATCWSDLVKPIVEFLACNPDVPVDELPHVTWCTTGALAFLPLHAAGLYDGSQPNASDLIVSSYTPTLSALLPSSTPTTNLNLGVLAVGQEDTQGFCHLPSTTHELASIQEHAKAVRFQQLTGSTATIDAVLSAMDENNWVHLACHATQNQDNPAQSAFHLHDGALTLETISKRSFKNKGLAFLSACQTATGDEELADEAIHLAAGMMMAGYPSVIATMWSIQDVDGPNVADVVYADLLKDGKMDHKQAARALHKAVAGLRKKVGDETFERWVPFIHIGV